MLRSLARLVHTLTAALVVLALPTAMSAAVFVGTAKVTGICPNGLGAVSWIDPITLVMEPGTGFGELTHAGTLTVTTDWMFDGRKSYFAASVAFPEVGPIVYYGTIKGSKLRGSFASHAYSSGCIFSGKLKAKLQ